MRLTCLHASTPARFVRRHRDENHGDVSDHVFESHNDSSQRHLRFNHTNLAGRPNTARSRYSTPLKNV